jgi:hypothetical protein
MNSLYEYIQDALIDKINSYTGKKLNEFLEFVVKERLFLKLQILYMMGNGETVCFWASSACLGTNGADELAETLKIAGMKDVKYAVIRLKMKDNEKNVLIPVLIEEILAATCRKAGRPSENFVIEMNMKDAMAAAIEFNVSRNRKYMVRNLTKIVEVSETFMEMQIKGVKFVGICKNWALEILDDDFVKNCSKKDIEKYGAIIPTIARDEKERKETDEIIGRLKGLSENESEHAGKKKEEASFLRHFSKIFKR